MSPRAATLLALALGIHLSIVGSVMFQPRPVIWPLHNDTIHRVGRGADFYAVYHAGVNVREGSSPYAGNDDGVTPYFYPFRYLPIVALAAQALIVLPPQSALLLWIVVVEALLGLLIFGLRRQIENTALWLTATTLLLISSPYFLELYMGQLTFATVALCGIALLLPRGPVTFTVSTLLKPLTLVALPALLRRGYWRYAVSAVAAVVVFSLPYFLLHPADWKHFTEANFNLEGGLGTGNHGFLMLLHLMTQDLGISWLSSHWGSATGALRWFILAAAALLVVGSKTRHVILGVCALLLAHFITYQHVWEHHLSAVMVIGALLLAVEAKQKWFVGAVLVSMVLLAIPTPYVLFDVAKDPRLWDPASRWPRAASYLIVLPKVVPTIVLFVVAVLKLCKAGQANAGPDVDETLQVESVGPTR